MPFYSLIMLLSFPIPSLKFVVFSLSLLDLTDIYYYSFLYYPWDILYELKLFCEPILSFVSSNISFEEIGTIPYFNEKSSNLTAPDLNI